MITPSHAITINRGKLGQQIDTYNQSIREIEAAYQQLDTAQKNLKAACVTDHYKTSYSVLPENTYSDPLHHLDRITERLKRQFWRYIVDMLEIRKFLSSQKEEELNKRLEEGDLPDITFAAVFAEIEAIVQSAQELKKEVVAEAFETLRPQPRYRSNYKTNQRWQVGKKVILTWKIEPGYDRPFRVQYGSEQTVGVIDRAFHILDGQPVREGYKSPLIDAINTSEDGTGQTHYFKFRACKNGNLHLQFLRLDLVKELNKIGGDHSSLGGGS